MKMVHISREIFTDTQHWPSSIPVGINESFTTDFCGEQSRQYQVLLKIPFCCFHSLLLTCKETWIPLPNFPIYLESLQTPMTLNIVPNPKVLIQVLMRGNSHWCQLEFPINRTDCVRPVCGGVRKMRGEKDTSQAARVRAFKMCCVGLSEALSFVLTLCSGVNFVPY